MCVRPRWWASSRSVHSGHVGTVASSSPAATGRREKLTLAPDRGEVIVEGQDHGRVLRSSAGWAQRAPATSIWRISFFSSEISSRIRAASSNCSSRAAREHLLGELVDELGQLGPGHALGRRRRSPARPAAGLLHRRLAARHLPAAAADRCAPPGPCRRPALVGVVGLAVDVVEDVADLLAQRLRVDAVRLVVGDLLGPAPVGLVDRLRHRRRDLVGVHVDLAGDVAGGPADGLDQRACRSAGSPPCRRPECDTSDTSGRSRPSRSRLMPTSTS